MVTRTVVFPIYPDEKQVSALDETIHLYSKAWNLCIDVAWDMEKPSAFSLHKLTYKKLKSELGLKSQYLCSARNRAAETVKAMRALLKKGKKITKPKVCIVPIRLDGRTLSFDKPRETASVATQHGRIKIPLIWHDQAAKYRDWSCKAGEAAKNKKGIWVLRLIFEKSVVKPKKTEKVIGIDRGINHAVVVSDNRFIGKHVWKEHERKLLLFKSKLQSKGTGSARRHLKKLSGRLRRFKQDCDRIVAKELLCGIQPGDTIVLERLTNIRERCGQKGKARKQHRAHMARWSFKRLEDTINYLAELNGIYIEYVEPHYTSQTCSKCGIVLKKNRKSQSFYSCDCGFKLNADLNAARNIANKWRMTSGCSSGLSVNQPIVTDSKDSVTSFLL